MNYNSFLARGKQPSTYKSTVYVICDVTQLMNEYLNSVCIWAVHG